MAVQHNNERRGARWLRRVSGGPAPGSACQSIQQGQALQRLAAAVERPVADIHRQHRKALRADDLDQLPKGACVS